MTVEPYYDGRRGWKREFAIVLFQELVRVVHRISRVQGNVTVYSLPCLDRPHFSQTLERYPRGSQRSALDILFCRAYLPFQFSILFLIKQRLCHLLPSSLSLNKRTEPCAFHQFQSTSPHRNSLCSGLHHLLVSVCRVIATQKHPHLISNDFCFVLNKNPEQVTTIASSCISISSDRLSRSKIFSTATICLSWLQND